MAFGLTRPLPRRWALKPGPLPSLGISHLLIRLRFCAVAASKNSSCAPVSPRRRSRSSFKIRFEVGEEHLHLLAFSHRTDELGGGGERSSHVARALVDAAGIRIGGANEVTQLAFGRIIPKVVFPSDEDA